MSLKQMVACCSAALALLPATAAAQGAGDDQYSDPFAGEEEAQPTATPRAPAATPAPAQPSQPAQPAPAQTAAPSQPAPAAAPAAPTLPYTGAEEWLVAAGGALLLGAGITLRVRLREPD